MGFNPGFHVYNRFAVKLTGCDRPSNLTLNRYRHAFLEIVSRILYDDIGRV